MSTIEEIFRKPITCANAGDMLALVRESIADTVASISDYRTFLKVYPTAFMRTRVQDHRDEAIQDLRKLRRREVSCLRLSA